MNKERHVGRLAKTGVAAVIAFSLLVASSAARGGILGVAEAATQNVSVKAVSLSGSTLSMWTTITKGSSTTTGFTPLSLAADMSLTNTVMVADYKDNVFDHWDNGSTSSARTLALGSDTTVTAYYKTASTTISDPVSTNTVLPKTGVYVALYMYPSGTGAPGGRR